MTEVATMELAVVNAQNAVEIFERGGLNAILEEIEAKVRAIPLDVSTQAGRDQIRSTAYKVVRTKTALDAEAKRLTEGWREATKKVNGERARAQERLDALAEEVRKPLTDFENKEKLRVIGHEDALNEITGLQYMLMQHPDMSLALLADHAHDLEKLHVGREWEEFAARAKSARELAESYVLARIETRKRFEAEQEELARLRKAEAERLQRERDEKLKAEAAEKARLEAELKAKRAADEEARRVIEAAKAEQQRVEAEATRVRLEHERVQREAEQARQREESARQTAEKRARDAEAAKVAAERAASEALKAAQDKAKRDAEAAVARERERVETERRNAEALRVKREADAKLRKRICEEIADDLYGLGIFGLDGIALLVAEAILDGKLRHVGVSF
jgi:colicin import membrane protein